MPYNRYLVTSALPYANGPLHFGHLAGVYIPADIYTRHRRQQGRTVKHIGGSDEHGVAIMLAAEKAGVDYSTYVTQWHEDHKRLFEKYEVSFDFFGRTSAPYHEEEVVKWFEILHEGGFIETKTEKQLFCLDDGRFLADRYVEGTCYNCGYTQARGDECPNCGEWIDAVRLLNPRSKISGSSRLEVRDTEQYYLLLTKFQEQFLEWFDTKSEWRKLVTGFVRGLLKNGPVDRAISRDLEWGIKIPLPNAHGKRLYVWFDAPIGYVSNLKQHLAESGSPDDYLKDWWHGDDVQISHFIGKDNIIFHAYIFPCMILGTKRINLPTELPANEFANLEGKQFSKSSGWYIDSLEAVSQFGVDAMRFYLCSIIPETGDSNFSWDGFQANQLEFGNKIGNYIHRCLTFQSKHFPDGLSAAAFEGVLSAEDLAGLKEKLTAITNHLDRYEFTRAQQALLALATSANEFFHVAEPWVVVKKDKPQAERSLAKAAIYVAILGSVLKPFTPGLSDKITANFQGFTAEDWTRIYNGEIELLVQKLQAAGFQLPAPPTVLIPRIDPLVIQKCKDDLAATVTQ